MAAVLYATHPRFADHDAGAGHPERPARLKAVEAGIAHAGLHDALITVTATPASDEALGRVHPEAYRRSLQNFCITGGGYLDGDTHVVPASWDAAVLAAFAEPVPRGYSVSVGEVMKGSTNIAAPAFEADGRATAAVLISAPTDRTTQADHVKLGALVRATALRLSRGEAPRL